MAELVPKDEWGATHAIGHEVFFLDIYRLLTHCLASAAIAALEDGTSQRPLSTFVTPNEQPEISRLLINIATYYRVKDDDGSWMHGHWLHKSFAGVGILVEDITKTTVTSSLDFRAACNKIIHAKKVHFDGETRVDTGVLHITPTVFLYGVKQKVEWKVTLDIVAFCRAAGNVIV